MSNLWSYYLIGGTVLSLVACFWIIVYANRQRASKEEIAKTEAEVWDENIRELNNPLPMWWLWLFVLTVIWSFLYLVYYPGLGKLGGVGGWSQEEQYAAEIAEADRRYGPVFARFGAMDIPTLTEDPQALAVGASLFQNYCAQCHGSSARGARGFPDLTDSEWLYGKAPAQVEKSIVDGRAGIMPPLRAVFASDEAVNEMVRYVLSMQDGMDNTSPAHQQYMSLCVACHGADGSGMSALGAPSLVNDIWLYGASDAEVRRSIVEGRNGVMPAHGALIGADRARILAAYVLSLGQ